MSRLPRFALARKSLILAALVLALFWSFAAALGMQRREDPGTTQRQTSVVTTWPGASTRDVEQLVTKKIADDVRGVAHVEHVEGTSRPGISEVDVVFDDAIDNADATLRDVRNHLADLHLAAARCWLGQNGRSAGAAGRRRSRRRGARTVRDYRR
jgi:multidrug efflux pump subunit AcrB